ncbi:MAG TPA: TatD family hydrolase [Steroidobacteraceae bacterium]|nr:TatD family hydrolase [Steroidobacteraceae bacterium]
MTRHDITGAAAAARPAQTPEGPRQRAPLIDIGINLAHDSYDGDRDAVIARAGAAGIVQMIVTGSSAASSRTAVHLSRLHPGVLFATAGVHPHQAVELTPDVLAELGEVAAEPQVVAVGECGLDYYRNYSPRPAQCEAFHRQLELAARCGKPVFLHQRDSHEDFIAILREHWPGLAGGVAHCFTGGPAELDCYLQLGLAIGITGWICDERRGAHLLELVRRIPAGRLLLETDGPYLLPRDLEPKPSSRRNEPAYLAHIAAVVARARGESVESLARASTEAARRLFRLPGTAAAHAL